MSKGHHGHRESYEEKEAHKLEKLYKEQKPWTDELNKIHREHPREYNKIFLRMNHEANVDKSLPKVEFFQDDNRQLKITVESSNKEHDPTRQRAEQYTQDPKTEKWKQEDATMRQAQKVIEASVASAADGVGSMMKPVADTLQWSNPGAKGIQAMINSAGKIAKEISEK